MAARGLRCDFTNFIRVALDVDYSPSWVISETTMEKRRDDLEGEIMGCEFEFVRDWVGPRKYHYHHEFI